MQGVEQIERVRMTVIRRVRGADHRWSDPAEHVGELARIEHPIIKAEIAALRPHPLHHLTAGLELGLPEAEMHAARPLVPNRNPGLRQELHGERRPLIGGEPGPALIMRRSVTLALHPDEAEVAA